MNIILQKKDNVNVFKYESQECRPIPVVKLVKTILNNTITFSVCTLCLCEENLQNLSDVVTLQDEETEEQILLENLVRTQLGNINVVSSQKLCRTCAKHLSNFYLFTRKCSKTAAAFRNLNISIYRTIFNLPSEIKDKKLFVDLPFQDIFGYIDNKSDGTKKTETPDSVTKVRNAYLNSQKTLINCTECDKENFIVRTSQIDPSLTHRCTICKLKFKSHEQTIIHMNNKHTQLDVTLTNNGIYHLSEFLYQCSLCHFKVNSCSEYFTHKEMHVLNGTAQNITEKKEFCSTCLKSGGSFINLSQMLYLTDTRTLRKSSLRKIVDSVFKCSKIKNTATNGVLCETCLNAALTAYYFIRAGENSMKVLDQCTPMFDDKNVGSMEKMQNDLNNDAEATYLSFNKVFVNKINQNVNFLLSSQRDHDIFDDTTDVLRGSDCEDAVPLSDLKKDKLFKRDYECSQCTETFVRFRQWEIHSRGHSKKTPHVCRLCHESFSTIQSLLAHRKKDHDDSSSLCYICHLIVPRKRKKKHMLHHIDQKLICNHCNKKFYSKAKIRKHILETHSTLVDVECQRCLKVFNNDFQYETHRCPYKCSDCLEQPCIHQKYLLAFREQAKDGHTGTQYKCVDCEFTFQYKYQLLAHANKEHLHSYPHLCDVCGEGFVSKEVLKYHKDYKHKKVVHCPHCSRAFKEQSVFEVHLPICQNTDKPYQCDLCNARFTSEEKSVFHRRKHFSRDFQCQFCLKKYWTKSELNTHAKRTHKDEIGPTISRKYECSMCPLDFTSKKDMLNHTSSHSGDSKHVCRICGASFKSKVNYYGHLRRHKIKKDKECPICMKLYNKYNIANHIRSHEMKDKGVISEGKEDRKLKKNTMCDICGQLLSNEKSLIKHREIHKEQQQCPHCLKYINSTIYDRHIRTHNIGAKEDRTNNKLRRLRKMFQCDKCEYSTYFAECLEAHENRFHLQVRPFKCDVCKKGFYAKLTLKEHIRTHSGVKPEQCEQCGNRFVNKKALRMHVRLHTGEKPYHCDLCDEKFLSASRRQAHRIRKHFEPSVQCVVCMKMYYTQSAVRLHIRDCHSGEPRQRSNKKKRV